MKPDLSFSLKLPILSLTWAFFLVVQWLNWKKPRETVTENNLFENTLKYFKKHTDIYQCFIYIYSVSLSIFGSTRHWNICTPLRIWQAVFRQKPNCWRFITSKVMIWEYEQLYIPQIPYCSIHCQSFPWGFSIVHKLGLISGYWFLNDVLELITCD